MQQQHSFFFFEFRCNPSLSLSLSISIIRIKLFLPQSSSIFKRLRHTIRKKDTKIETWTKQKKNYLTWKLNNNWCKHQSLMYLYEKKCIEILVWTVFDSSCFDFHSLFVYFLWKFYKFHRIIVHTSIDQYFFFTFFSFFSFPYSFFSTTMNKKNLVYLLNPLNMICVYVVPHVRRRR